MRFTTRLLFTVPVLVFSATATTILNRAKGPLPSFDEPLNLPQDPHIDEDPAPGGILDIDVTNTPGLYFKIFRVVAKYFRCYDVGFCLCRSTAISDPLTTPTADATGQDITGRDCIIAPYVRTHTGTDEYRMAIREVSEAKHQHDLDRISAEVNQALHQEMNTWKPTNGLVITWKMSDGAVPPAENEFQAVISTDGHQTHVLYLYGTMAATSNPVGVDNVRGFLYDGRTSTARICNFEEVYDAPLIDANLPTYSNRKCGNSGVYVFKPSTEIINSPAGCWDGIDSTQYTGTVAVTENGHTCQAWNTQTPNVHDFNSDAYFTLDGSVNAVMNFCRDPGEKGWPWCYTTHVDIQKDVCNVTLCAEGCWDGVTSTSYTGTVSTTESGYNCQLWTNTAYNKDSDFPHDASVDAAMNYCRDPGAANKGRPWCYTTNPDVFYEFCEVPLCEAGCWDGVDSTQYIGTEAVDQNGLTCEMWRNTAYNQDVNFPHDDSVDAVMNYCRDPEGTIGTPWCYTTYDVIRWEFCAVQLCDAGCWDGVDATQYIGTVSVTTTGLTCQAWNVQTPWTHAFGDDAHFPLDGTVDAAKNYCRSPNGDILPWCFAADASVKWEYCNITRCSEMESECPKSSAATSCSSSFTNNNPSCNVTSKPVDTCTEGYVCTRNETDSTIAHLTVIFKGYKHGWVQALNYTTFRGSGAEPDGVQEFVQGDPVGSCSKLLLNPNTPGNYDSVELTISLDPTDSIAKRCGFEVDAAAGTISFAVKNYDWDGTQSPTSFGPSARFDQAADVIVYGTCFLGDLKLKINQTNVDPFGIHAVSCQVSNDAGFPPSSSPLFTEQFITNGCPTDPSTGVIRLSKGFAVPSSYYENPKPNPWCIYAGPIKARRWTKFGGIPLELLDILHLRCEVLFCATLDGLIPRDLSTEEQKCYDNCLSDDRRRRRSAVNETNLPSEMVYASLKINKPEDVTKRLEECVSYNIVMTTIITLIALVSTSTAMGVMIFLKLLKTMKEKIKTRTPRKSL